MQVIGPSASRIRAGLFAYVLCLPVELPSLPAEVAKEVTAFFRFISSWLTSVMERGAKEKTLNLSNEPGVEAEVFLATVYRAMLSARAYGNAEVFATILAPALSRLSPVATH